MNYDEETEPPDPNVWFQISRGHRTVARLPEGMTGIEALIEYAASTNIRPGDYVTWAQRMGEGHAGDHYLRCGGSERLTLTREAFELFRKNGGDTYTSKHFQLLTARHAKLETMTRDEAAVAIVDLVDASFVPGSPADHRNLLDSLALLAGRRRT